MIERLDAADADAAVALWAQAGLTRPWNDAAADFTRAVAGPASAVLGIRDGGLLAGTAMVGHDGHRGWVYYLAVADPARGRGLGRQLMAAAEAWLVERGIPKLQFMVRTDNAVVLDFYDHLGYARQDVLVLGRRLDE
ncbi:MAG: GNAT family acetyltransferase [Nocardioides sp.]|uniref:GNAT family acetyltransferase n=1 Tax=Nocardioides sp. TaxID=35761 RepID=UPI0039E4DC48